MYVNNLLQACLSKSEMAISFFVLITVCNDIEKRYLAAIKIVILNFSAMILYGFIVYGVNRNDILLLGCGCHLSHTTSEGCDVHGKCVCKENYDGQTCGQCKLGYVDFPICRKLGNKYE